MNSEEIYNAIQEDIATQGYGVVGRISGDSKHYYTVDLVNMIGCELYINGPDPDLAERLLDGVVSAMKAQEEDVGAKAVVIDGILSGGYSVALMPVADPALREKEAVFAVAHHGSADFPMRQIVIPDIRNRFPWEEDCSDEFRKLQILHCDVSVGNYNPLDDRSSTVVKLDASGSVAKPTLH